MRSPVLFLVFNRPKTTRRVFEAIRAARPPKLYIAADGPRPDRPDESRRCDEVRSVASAVDWPCEVETLFRERNLGSKMAVSRAITWFFSREQEGIILEDDVLPVGTFFDFCDKMLERYRDDDRIAMISGSNLISNRFRAKESYFFSRYCNIWGWASWRRSWQHYDVTMADWPAWRDGNGLAKVSGGSRLFESYWRRTFDAAYAAKIDTCWDYQWTFTCWRRGALTILPALNQTSNLGFGADATNTVAEAPRFVVASFAQPLKFPLIHPDTVRPDAKADASIGSSVYGINILTALNRRLSALPLLGNMIFSIKELAKNVIR
jgi:hypothetical protein